VPQNANGPWFKMASDKPLKPLALAPTFSNSRKVIPEKSRFKQSRCSLLLWNGA